MRLWILFFFIVIITLQGCKPRSQYKPINASAETISAKLLWDHITRECDYKNYAYWPGHESFQNGQSPHGRFHKIYINPVLYNALPVADRITPEKSIIVKESYNSNKELMNYVVMAKIPKFNEFNNDWFWAAYEPDGKIIAEGAVESCIDCHAGMIDNDYIIVRKLDKALRY